MCGLAGFINRGSRDDLLRMVDLQYHRGPDDGGTWVGESATGELVGLGSRRLAILDLSKKGHMPMASDDGDVILVYNGEVYNHVTLRDQLIKRGHRFRSDTDTEVVLRAYLEFGPAFVSKLNGMFALAIWDSRQQELLLARDHFGIKPLYYSLDGNSIAFASEIKSLLALPSLNREMDNRSLSQYLTFLWVPEPKTIFKHIQKLPPGHTLTVGPNGSAVRQYWDLTFPHAGADFPMSERDVIEEVRSRFYKAVKSQLRSDVSLGAFLSAGIDSSSIVAAMSEVSDAPVSTFTVAFPSDYTKGELHLDDTDVAARTAAHFGCKHREILVEPDVVDLLPKLTYHIDEPVADPAIITAFLVNQAAKPHATVMMSGIGGDELFAGYRKHRAHYLAAAYRKIPGFIRRSVVEPVIGALPAMRGSASKGYIRLAKKMARSGGLPPVDRFIMDSVYLSEDMKQDLCSGWLSGVGDFDPRQAHLDCFARVSDADFLNQMLYVDTKTFMPSLNLLYNDKMSMACSVEVRVPFLDWEFADWVAMNVPPAMKLKGQTGKYVLREAMRGILPDEIFRQKKAGFGAPIDYWLAYDLREMVDDLLSPRRIGERGLFDPSAVARMIGEQRSGSRDWSAQIWQLLTFELWQQQCADQQYRPAA